MEPLWLLFSIGQTLGASQGVNIVQLTAPEKSGYNSLFMTIYHYHPCYDPFPLQTQLRCRLHLDFGRLGCRHVILSFLFTRLIQMHYSRIFQMRLPIRIINSEHTPLFSESRYKVDLFRYEKMINRYEFHFFAMK